ncbi:hypothetical protein HMPREF9318_00161 [Streptococcus urinalis FB127-CNA-2]|uniref:PF07997 family protein n=1 Tax=Streptococcus urinalis 2285-97 TaxID=764291 RepID=G5KEZ6_9STRE|nr:YueI family protein [Streptococcus urinalis]EHJ55769.1 hypothetical protein STRUR_0900 [Streptococcus urinalis 2285-97]EKS21963.1 hypothetical protein HMPREF9318_00161 [Streptococcus urinalis FB127-CNA-2]VEF31776.1 glycogen synthase [Streptococcus urinalis]
MTNLDDKLMRAASGEKRLDPDQQRQYLGTFEERVLLYLTIDDAEQAQLLKRFDTILDGIMQKEKPLFVKIASKLSNSQQVQLMKIAQSKGIAATIVTESSSQSPYGLVIHTNHAISKESIFSLNDFFEKTKEKESSSLEEKKSFWSGLFHKNKKD